MPIQVVCDKCGRSATFADNDAGLAVSCLGCRKTLRVPAKTVAKLVTPVIETAPPLRAPTATPTTPATPPTPPAAPVHVSTPARAHVGAQSKPHPPALPRPAAQRSPSTPRPAAGNGQPAAPISAPVPRQAPARSLAIPLSIAALLLLALGLAAIKIYSTQNNPAPAGDALASATQPTTATAPATRPASATAAASATPNAPAPAPTPPPPTPLPIGLIGLESLEFHSTAIVDAYDASTGQYDSDRAADTALVASNGPIRASGEIRIKGAVRPGREPFNPGKRGKVTGSILPLDAPLVAPPVDVAGLAAKAQSARAADLPAGILTGRNLVVTGKRAVAIPPGVYDVQDLIVDSKCTLRCDGPVTLLVRGRMTIMGTLETFQNRPRDLAVRVAGHGPVVLATRADIYADLYAPAATVDLTGAGDFFGSLVARALRTSGKHAFHIDQSLARR